MVVPRLLAQTPILCIVWLMQVELFTERPPTMRVQGELLGPTVASIQRQGGLVSRVDVVSCSSLYVLHVSWLRPADHETGSD